MSGSTQVARIAAAVASINMIVLVGVMLVITTEITPAPGATPGVDYWFPYCAALLGLGMVNGVVLGLWQRTRPVGLGIVAATGLFACALGVYLAWLLATYE